MDARAWSNLSSAPPEVKNLVMGQFKPRREGEDDYSALISSFVRSIIIKREQRGLPGGRDVRGRSPGRDGRDGGARREDHVPSREQSPASAFRARYPMDERAFGVLQNASPSVQQTVMADFRPRREGDDDYSALVMAFVRAVQGRVGISRPAADSNTGPPAEGRSREPRSRSRSPDRGE